MITVVRGNPDGPLAVVLPGTASSADFVARAFGPALAHRGVGLATAHWPGDAGAPIAAVEAELEAFLERRTVVLLGGVSLGAHLVARVAARLGPAVAEYGVRGLALTLPAWTGPPEQVAALSGAAAQRLSSVGVDRALAEMRQSALPWVHAELASAWSLYREDELIALLRATAASHAPTATELAAIAVPSGLLAFSDDPFHPLAVSREWARALPSSYLSVTTLDQAGRNVRSMGDLALGALDAALSLTAGSLAGSGAGSGLGLGPGPGPALGSEPPSGL